MFNQRSSIDKLQYCSREDFKKRKAIRKHGDTTSPLINGRIFPCKDKHLSDQKLQTAKALSIRKRQVSDL